MTCPLHRQCCSKWSAESWVANQRPSGHAFPHGCLLRLQHGSEYASGTDDEDSSLADSAFVAGQHRTAAHHKYSGSQADFDRMSARLEREMGLGTDNESLASLKARRWACCVQPTASMHVGMVQHCCCC